jgi:hypothetical protein
MVPLETGRSYPQYCSFHMCEHELKCGSSASTHILSIDDLQKVINLLMVMLNNSAMLIAQKGF